MDGIRSASRLAHASFPPRKTNGAVTIFTVDSLLYDKQITKIPINQRVFQECHKGFDGTPFKQSLPDDVPFSKGVICSFHVDFPGFCWTILANYSTKWSFHSHLKLPLQTPLLPQLSHGHFGCFLVCSFFALVSRRRRFTEIDLRRGSFSESKGKESGSPQRIGWILLGGSSQLVSG